MHHSTNEIIEENDEVCFTLRPRTETIVEINFNNPTLEGKDISLQKVEIVKDFFFW